MHISEGILSAPVLAVGWGIAAAGIAVGLKKTPPEKISRVAVLSAAIFLISLIRVPVGPSSVHLTLFGVMGVMLGMSVVPAIFVALLLQALLFQFGGIVVLGVNTVNLSVAALTGCLVYKYLPCRLPLFTGFMTGFLAVITGSVMLVIAMLLSSGSFVATSKLIFAANIPLALVEGIITMFIITFLRRMLPEFIEPENKHVRDK